MNNKKIKNNRKMIEKFNLNTKKNLKKHLKNPKKNKKNENSKFPDKTYTIFKFGKNNNRRRDNASSKHRNRYSNMWRIFRI
jgi:hypothetical protein